MAGGLAVAPILAGCFGSGITYRYRMTVFVDTKVGPRSGSSVIEVRTSAPGLPSAKGYRNEVRGEAVAVDLPDRQTLFVLLKRGVNAGGAELYPNYAYDIPASEAATGESAAEYLLRQTRPARLPADRLPIFIRFRDPADARTVELVDAADLSARFGAGTRLDRVEIQMTQDPVTSTIEARLPDFGEGSGYAHWERQLYFTDPRRLSLTDFRRGF